MNHTGAPASLAPDALPVVEELFPGTPPSPPPRLADRLCCIVIGNHISYVAIVEMVHALHSYFASHFTTLISRSLMPGAINVVIDEFGKPSMVAAMQEVRAADPATRFVIMATEFVTRMDALGLHLGNTFNYFGVADNRRELLRCLAYQFHARPLPSYFQSRYRGFVDALPLADLLLCAHPAIAATMALLPADVRRGMAEPLTLYPQINVPQVAADLRLYRRPPGVMMTGTLTPYRERIGQQLAAAFRGVDVRHDLYMHRPFDPDDGMRFTQQGVDLGYTRDHTTVASTPEAFLYNINPPQQPTWRYSSPMRLQRAILLGQIPLVTRRFRDHPIEEVALAWDGTTACAEKLWIDAAASRVMLVARHVDAVARYDADARQRNAAIDAALDALA